MRRLRLERLARCRSSCLTLIQSCGMLAQSSQADAIRSRKSALFRLATFQAVRPIPALRQAARSLSPRASIWQINYTRSGVTMGFRPRLGVAAGFLAHLSPARDALSFLFAFVGNFASAVATINSQVELMEGFAAISRALSGGSYLPLIIFLSFFCSPTLQASQRPIPS